MENITLKVNRRKVAKRQVGELVKWLKRQGKKINIIWDKDEVLPGGTDILIVMGGDGTFLGGARMAAPLGIPVLGIDFGGLGFLSEVDAKEATLYLKKIFDGHYNVEERMVLECTINRGEEMHGPFLAVNDVVISKTSVRLLRLKVHINNEYFHEYPGDGVIVSSSTGSTAYSLSAGGPIVSPELGVMVITSICPHTLFARSIVISGDDEITVAIPPDRNDVVLTIDGQIEHPLMGGDVLYVRKSEHTAKLIRVKKPRFYETVRDKFRLT